MTEKHLIAEMTFREFEAAIAADPVILLPMGSQEEHGPSAPMGDFMLTAVIASRVAQQSGALAAPTVPFGYADYFRPVPGGIQLRAATFCAVLRDFADNFLDHGLNKLVILNGHSGNAPLIDQTTRQIRADRGVVIPSINLWRLHTPSVWTEAYGVPAGQGFGHGAEPVSSAYACLFPALMRPDLAEQPRNQKRFLGFETAGLGAVRFRGVDIAVPLDITDVTDNGIASGDPSLVSAQAGERMLRHMVDTCAAFVEAFRQSQPPQSDV